MIIRCACLPAEVFLKLSKDDYNNLGRYGLIEGTIFSRVVLVFSRRLLRCDKPEVAGSSPADANVL